MTNGTEIGCCINPQNIHYILRKSEQRKNLHDPIYLLMHEYVPNTPLMLVLAKDILFCRYQYQSLEADNYLKNDGTDYEKLRSLLRYDYGLDINVASYFASHRLHRLMNYVEKNVSPEYRQAVLDRNQAERELTQELFNLFGECCKGSKPRMTSNPAFLDIDFKQFEDELYRRYHILFSPDERRQKSTVQEILLHLIFRLRDGGRLKNS